MTMQMCYAERQGDEWYCARCDLRWSAVPPEDKPECSPKPALRGDHHFGKRPTPILRR